MNQHKCTKIKLKLAHIVILFDSLIFNRFFYYFIFKIQIIIRLKFSNLNNRNMNSEIDKIFIILTNYIIIIMKK
jgi:hypothetical protein